MPIDITIPRLGWNMDEGVFVGWLKKDGDPVKAGDPIFSLETDKSVQEIESLDSGTLRVLSPGPQPGEMLAVGTVIGHIVSPGETDPVTAIEPTRDEAPARAATPTEAENRSRGETRAELSQTVVRGSPRARRKARELGIDWTRLAGSGRGGRIRERDVLAAASGGLFDADGTARSLPIDATRRTIAERMMESARSTAPVTLTTNIDATNLVNLRQQFKAADAAGIGYNDVVIKLSALALERHEIMNSRWEGDRIVQPRGIHIGLAVDTEAGLVVPVIRDVPNLTLRQISAQARELTDRARRRKLKPEEMLGGTFTVTNLGPYGVEAFTPIINLPQCAILGLGRIQDHSVLAQHQLVSRSRMTLSLTFDHRIVDGAPAARFLQTLSGLLENPSPWLMP